MSKIKRSFRDAIAFSKEVNEKYSNNIQVVGRYKGLGQPIIFKDKYGTRKIAKAENLIYGNKVLIPYINSAMNKTAYFMNVLREYNPILAGGLLPASEYINSTTKMLFTTKYGEVSIIPASLLQGKVPGIKAAVNKKAYTIAQANEIHNNKYDYSKIIELKRKGGVPVDIICPLHGVFRQSIDNHINKECGCPICSKVVKDSKRFRHSTNGNGYFVYVVRLESYDKLESFYKVGYTGFSSKQRFDKVPYSIIECNFYKFNTIEEALEAESIFHTNTDSVKHIPNMYFTGYSECYVNNPINTGYFSNFKLYDIV